MLKRPIKALAWEFRPARYEGASTPIAALAARSIVGVRRVGAHHVTLRKGYFSGLFSFFYGEQFFKIISFALFFIDLMSALFLS
jgi:hypothetical protein